MSDDMASIEPATFRMGSDDHYPEEAPVRERRPSTASGSTAAR